MRSNIIILTVLSLTLILSNCIENEAKRITEIRKKSSPLLIKKVNIFDGKSEQLLSEKDVLINRGVIEAIEVYIPGQPHYEVIDGQGKTLMPGLIDSHVHLSGSGAVPWANQSANVEYNLSAYLYAGVTTIYDLGGLAGDISKLAKQVESGDIEGPTIYNTHIPITIKDSHPIPLTEQMLSWPLKSLVNTISPTIDHPNEAKEIIESYIDHDIDYVKIICDQIPPGSPEMSFDQLKSLIDEAHEMNKKVFVHIGSPDNAISAVKAGADVLAHGVWRGKLTPEQADTIAASQIPIIYTVSGFCNIRHIYNGEYHPSELDKHLVSEQVLTPVTGENGMNVRHQEVMNEFFEDVTYQSQFWFDNFRLLHDRKVPILVGTDSNLPGTYAGSTYFQELDLLKEFGMSNYEILKGATYLNSIVFLENPDFGFVKVGNKADLLLIKGNPLEDIDLVKDPALILLRGDVIEKITDP